MIKSCSGLSWQLLFLKRFGKSNIKLYLCKSFMKMIIENKKCNKCGNILNLDYFPKSREAKDGRKNSCKKCVYKKNKEYPSYRKLISSSNKRQCMEFPDIEDYRNHRRELRFIKEYGITLEQYEKLLNDQNYKCASCNEEETVKVNNIVKRLSVDHCHKTGKVRGLLCHNCNLALGMLKDDLSKIDNLKKYLQNSLV